MVIRITTAQRFSVALRGVFSSLNRVQDIQQQIVTGKRIINPSDDPAGISKVLNLRGLLSDSNQFMRNIDTSRAFINVTDQSISSIRGLVLEARTLMVGQAGAPADASTRRATAISIARIREGIIQLANTEVAGRFIYSGTKVSTLAFAADGTYQGNNGSINVNVAVRNSITMNISATSFLTTDLDPDLFQTSALVKSTAPITDQFVIDATNQDLVVQEFPSAVKSTITLTAGTYTGDALAAEVETQIEAAGGTVLDYTVTYDEDTDKFTIAVPEGGGAEVKIFSAGGDAASTAAALLGFPNDSLQAASAVSNSPTAFNVIAGTNNTFSISVDGGTSTSITVPAGVYTGESLATELQLQINNNVKEVTASNNKIRILEDGGARAETFTLTTGTKSGTALASELQTLLNASTTLTGSTASGGTGYDVTYNATADKFTLTRGTPAVTVGVDVSEGALAGLMGFTKDPPFSTLAISDTNLTGAKVDYSTSFKDLFTISSPTLGTTSAIALTAGGTDILPTLKLNAAAQVSSQSTLLADLNRGRGVVSGSILVTNRAGASFTVDLTTAQNINDVINSINSIVTGVTASVGADGKRLVLEDTNTPIISNLIVKEVGTTTTALDLGIRGSVPGDIVGLDLDPNVSSATAVSALRDGLGISLGKISLGNIGVVDLALGSGVSVGDLLSAINTASTLPVNAIITSDGTHLEVFSTDPSLSVLATDQTGETAKQLGFQGGGNNVLGLLKTMEEAMKRNDEKTIQDSLDAFTAALDRISIQQIEVGEISKQFDRFELQHEEIEVSFTELLSKIEDVDMIRALTDFSIFQNSLQAALASTAQILQVQLLDFLN